MNKIKLAIAPIGWSNDDLPELGGHISFEQCIKEMSEAEFQGCEVGNKFPRQPEVLHKALLPYKLSIASAWFSTYFTEENREQETINNFINHMQFLKAMGANIIVVCECGHSMQSKSVSVFNNKHVFNETEWKNLINGLHHLGELAAQNNMSIVYHHHMGTGVQSQHEIDYLMQETNPNFVSLLLDTGHLYFAGVDPLIILKKYSHRIKHVHLKDIRDDILKQVHTHNLSFLDAVKAGVFTVPGDGCINYQPIFDELLKINYHGWWVVEAEQDPDKANPLEYAIKARKYLREMVGL